MGQPTGPSAHAVDHDAVFQAIPTPYLVMTPDLVIVDANPAYLANVGRTLEELQGRPVFEAFPPTEDALDESGVPRVQRSFERARDTGVPDVMPLLRYDIPDVAAAATVERFWSLISVPVPAPDGTVALVVQRAEDVTDVVRERELGQAEREQGEVWRRRVEEVETDLYARAQELTAAVGAKELATRRLTGLAEVALQLGSAETLAELAEILFAAALPVLEAASGSLAVCRPDSDQLEVTVTADLGDRLEQAHTRIPLHGPLPLSRAARGHVVVVADVVTAERYDGLPEAMRLTGTQALVALPLLAGTRALGSLAVGFRSPRAFPDEEIELLRAFAAQCAQVLDRLQVRQAERDTATARERVSETLQRSLLTPPPEVDGVEIAVRYLPASQTAQVGGDWYDAFLVPASDLTLVIGDVAGHDEDAAAAMGQVRNVLRGVAQTLGEPPAAVLAGLDRALDGLQLNLLATVVVASLTGAGEERTFTWCNAGHPPPVLLRADGTARLLTGEPDLLVGLTPDLSRSDHSVLLGMGDTVLLYTDGLVETRGGDIEADLQGLLSLVVRLDADGPQALVDAVVAQLDELSDDVALLAVTVR